MTKYDSMLCVLGAVLAVFCSLTLWRLAFFSTDLAYLALLPLLLMIAIGTYRNAVNRRRALLSVTLKSSSSLQRFARGRVFSAVTATSVAIFCTATLGYKSLFAGLAEVLAVIIITSASASCYVLGLRWFERDITAPSLSWFSAKFAFFMTCAASFIPYILIEIVFVTRSGAIDADFSEAISESLARLPTRNSMLDEVVSIITFLDTVRLWLIAMFDNAAIWIIYGIYAALVCAVIATTAISIATLYHSHIAPSRLRPVDHAGEPE